MQTSKIVLTKSNKLIDDSQNDTEGNEHHVAILDDLFKYGQTCPHINLKIRNWYHINLIYFVLQKRSLQSSQMPQNRKTQDFFVKSNIYTLCLQFIFWTG